MEWLKDAGFQRDIKWTEGENCHGKILPEWASFLIWLGCTLKRFQSKDFRIFCVVLLPTRICCSALSAIGSLLLPLTNPRNTLSWELFLECEKGLNVYFLELDKDGKYRRLEGELGSVDEIRGQKLRRIDVISNRENTRNLTYQIGASKFKEIGVSFQPHNRSRLLNDLDQLSDFFKESVTGFNENQLLVRNTETVLVTNVARWQRENENVLVGIGENETSDFIELKEATMIRLGRTLLCSPKSSELQHVAVPLGILDGLDAFRSRELVQADNLLVLLNQNEFENEAEDICKGFSAYSLEKAPERFKLPSNQCPSGISTEFYVFERRRSQ